MSLGIIGKINDKAWYSDSNSQEVVGKEFVIDLLFQLAKQIEKEAYEECDATSSLNEIRNLITGSELYDLECYINDPNWEQKSVFT